MNTNNKYDSSEYWIYKLKLTPHPEGGYFRETYRGGAAIPTPSDTTYYQLRTTSTAIYYLLKSGQISALHRLKSDEVLHFYYGSSLAVYTITPEGELKMYRLGNDHEIGETFQLVITAGTWFGFAVADTDSFALIGCTVSPGFDFQDFEMGNREKLINEYPIYKEVIEMLTYES